jgi:hypothetical protein
MFFPRPAKTLPSPPPELMTERAPRMPSPPVVFFIDSAEEAARVRKLGIEAIDGTDAQAVVAAIAVVDFATAIIADNLPLEMRRAIARATPHASIEVSPAEIATLANRHALIDFVGAAVAVYGEHL